MSTDNNNNEIVLESSFIVSDIVSNSKYLNVKVFDRACIQLGRTNNRLLAHLLTLADDKDIEIGDALNLLKISQQSVKALLADTQTSAIQFSGNDLVVLIHITRRFIDDTKLCLSAAGITPDATEACLDDLSNATLFLLDLIQLTVPQI